MANRAPARAAIPDEDMPRLLSLMKGSNSVELKLTVPDSQQRSAATALGLDPLDAQIRQVFFLDTSDLALNRAGVVVRARRVQNKGDDSVVKLRPVVPDELPAELRRSEGFGVEVDAMPGGFVCSGSMKGTLRSGAVKEAVAGTRPLRKLFSKRQRAFYADFAPPGVALDDLMLLGPIFVLKLKFSPKQFGRRMVAELWLYPDSTRVLELSTKCAPDEGFQVAAEARALLAERGVSLSGEQQTKTRKALDLFSAELAD
jgi:hypothetical protein